MRHGRSTGAVRRFGAVLAIVTCVLVAGLATAGGDWNDANIDWKDYTDGLAAAKSQNKPVCLIFYTEWCPHCANYSKVFHDQQVVARAKDFVMIRLDKDKHGDISSKYAPDGEYIPRTYFLSPAGTLEPDIHAPRDNYKYFYDEKDPASVLAGMDQALQRLK